MLVHHEVLDLRDVVQQLHHILAVAATESCALNDQQLATALYYRHKFMLS